jgi:hypothetical protein
MDRSLGVARVLRRNAHARNARNAIKHRCTWCLETDATESNRDAANKVHWWHPACWTKMRRWLAGESTAKIEST